jgi:hemoglobin
MRLCTEKVVTTDSSNSLARASGDDIGGTGPDTSLFKRLGGHEGILKLIKPFYADLRQHAILGPIFNRHIQDWPAHLHKIADFWALQTGGDSRYRGGFGAAHVSLGIGVEHFQHWLELWEFNNARQLEPREAAGMNALAQQLAARLLAITQRRCALTIGMPALPPTNSPGS